MSGSSSFKSFLREIVRVVLGILIAFMLNNWSDIRKNRKVNSLSLKTNGRGVDSAKKLLNSLKSGVN